MTHESSPRGVMIARPTTMQAKDGRRDAELSPCLHEADQIDRGRRFEHQRRDARNQDGDVACIRPKANPHPAFGKRATCSA